MRSRARASAPGVGNLHRHQHVLERRQRGDEVKELEDDADLAAPESRKRFFPERRDVDSVEQDATGRRRIQAGDETQQCGFSAARRPGDGGHTAVVDAQRRRMQNREGRTAARDGTRHAD
jgi:hypothetical protein